MDTQRFPRVLLAIGLLSLASVSLIGCNNESSYCDDTGCYFCDGLGCRLVNPPTRGTCTCGSACLTGSACTSLGCTVTCTTDAGCPMGTRCAAAVSGASVRYCLGPREPAPTATDCSCTSDAMCTHFGANYVCGPAAAGGRQCQIGCNAANPCPMGQTCIDTMCRPIVNPVGCPTVACATGEVCLDGSCHAQTSTCQFNTECNGVIASRVCVNQQCTTACTAGSCPSGSTCGTDGFCHETIPPVTGCTTGADCTGAGATCVNGRCFAGCDATHPCPAGDFCDAGVCRLDTRPAPGCGNGRPCTGAAVCHNGACRNPCTMDSDCPRFDVQTPFCIPPGPMGVCSTTAEATSNCTSAAMCHVAGQACVNGTCH